MRDQEENILAIVLLVISEHIGGIINLFMQEEQKHLDYSHQSSEDITGPIFFLHVCACVYSLLQL